MPGVTQHLDDSTKDERESRIVSLTARVRFEIIAEERMLCKQVGSSFTDDEEHIQQKHTGTKN